MESDGTVRIFDVQSRLETDLTYQQKMNAVVSCLNHDSKLHMRPLNSLNLLCNFISSHTLGTRSENDRNELLCCNFTRRVGGIGPNGMEASCVICNRGKTNKSGRLNVGGSVAHKNPLFSADAAKGLLLFYRFKILVEPWPDFTNLEDFMRRPTLRSERNYKIHLSDHQQCNLFKKLYDVIDYSGNASELF